MSRKGRELELLIEKLEKITLPKDALVISPGFIIDRITGQSREVDILIEYQLGTSLLKIIIECRDRTSTQDVTWIEQIQTKVSDLKANKVIAVSSSPFTEQAKVKAKHYGIEARTYSEISPDIIKSWWQVEHIQTITNQFHLISVIINSNNSDAIKDVLNGKTTDDKFIHRTTDDKIFSLNELFLGLSENIQHWNSLTINGPALRITVNANYVNDQDCFFLQHNNIESKITSITFVANLSIVAKNVPISKVLSYNDDEKTISQVIEFEVAQIGDNQIIQIIKNPNGTINLSTRKKTE